MRHNHILSFSVLASTPTFLLASNRASVFFFMVFMFSPNVLTSSGKILIIVPVFVAEATLHVIYEKRFPSKLKATYFSSFGNKPLQFGLQNNWTFTIVVS